jgi:alkylation response protein AidB-like acyl-CoA dehydrogenase
MLLKHSRDTLEKYAPGFDAKVAAIPFSRREAIDGGLIAEFKNAGPVDLLIPSAAGGRGADALEATHVQVALGSRSPSLAVGTTMHQFSVASLVALSSHGGGAEALILRAIAERKLLVSSGFAEGVPGQGILESSMRANEVAGGVQLSGVKRPCSLAQSMDLLTASYVRSGGDGNDDELMVALVPAKTPGIHRKPYWVNKALGGAESDELRLDNVFVPFKMVFSAGPTHRLNAVQTIGFIWFELLISASYLGACAGLVEQVIERGRWNSSHRVELAMAIQTGLSALEGIAHKLDARDGNLDALLANLLLVRYQLEDLVTHAANKAHEMLGGTSFIVSEDTSQWLLSCLALRFHPPARISMHEHLSSYLLGKEFAIG